MFSSFVDLYITWLQPSPFFILLVRYLISSSHLILQTLCVEKRSLSLRKVKASTPYSIATLHRSPPLLSTPPPSLHFFFFQYTFAIDRDSTGSLSLQALFLSLNSVPLSFTLLYYTCSFTPVSLLPLPLLTRHVSATAACFTDSFESLLTESLCFRARSRFLPIFIFAELGFGNRSPPPDICSPRPSTHPTSNFACPRPAPYDHRRLTIACIS
jgi:hypothetical protein